VNGTAVAATLVPGSYAEVHRTWQPKDVVHLRLPMPPRLVQSHPYVLENTGRVALMRGPLLYCVEGADHPGVDLRDLVFSADAEVAVVKRAGLMGGVVTLVAAGKAQAPDPGWWDRLYRAAGTESRSHERAVEIIAIPYYTWANREPGQMQVWLRAG